MDAVNELLRSVSRSRSKLRNTCHTSAINSIALSRDDPVFSSSALEQLAIY